jgi:hypothetical protein
MVSINEGAGWPHEKRLVKNYWLRTPNHFKKVALCNTDFHLHTFTMEQPDLSSWKLPAILLLLGGIIFWIGACYPPYRQWMTSDTKEYLTIVGQNKINWYIIHGCFLLGVIVTVIGVQLFSQSLIVAGKDNVYANIGQTAFFFGAGFWIINIVFRLTVTLWAAERLLASGDLYDSFKTWMDWSNLLFSIYMVLAYAAIGFLALSLKQLDLVPSWVSWFSIIFGFVGTVGYIVRIPIYEPPLMVHLPFMITGIMLLIRIRQ